MRGSSFSEKLIFEEHTFLFIILTSPFFYVSLQVDSSSWEFLDQNICNNNANVTNNINNTNNCIVEEDPLQRQIRLNSEAADIIDDITAGGRKEDVREGSSSGDSMYHTDFSSNLTSNTSGGEHDQDQDQSTDHSSRSPESVSREKLLETSEDDVVLETSLDLVSTNFQRKAWNSSQDQVQPPFLPRGNVGSSHAVRTNLFEACCCPPRQRFINLPLRS